VPPGRASARSTTRRWRAHGKHYAAAAPEWNDKPYGFADFLRARASTIRSPTARSFADQFSRTASTTDLQCGSRAGAGPACTTCTKRAPVRPGDRLVIPSQTSGSRPPTTTRPGGGTYFLLAVPTNEGDSADHRTNPAAPFTVAAQPAERRREQLRPQPLANFHAKTGGRRTGARRPDPRKRAKTSTRSTAGEGLRHRPSRAASTRSVRRDVLALARSNRA